MDIDEEAYNEFLLKMRSSYEPSYKINKEPGALFTDTRDFRRWHQKLPFMWTYKPFYQSRTLKLPMTAKTKKGYTSNKLQNNKYSWYGFLPLSYLSQFRYVYNIFFFVTTLSQFFPSCRVGYLFQHVAPFVIVLTVAVLKELFDEIRQRIQDQKVNNEMFTLLTSNGEQEVHSSNICSSCRYYCCSYKGKNGICYIKTIQLDGETDWKIRRAVPFTQTMDQQDIPLSNLTIDAEPPTSNISSFFGRIRKDGVVHSLDVENIIWSGSTTTSEDTVGIVIYTGKESKAGIDREEPTNKLGATEKELNNLTVMSIGLLGIVVLLMSICNSIWGNFTFVSFARFVIVCSPMIPISLRVNLEVSKLFYSFLINFDPNIPGTTVRNTNLPEALGKIDYLFTDKTGTLTINEMELKRISMEHMKYTSNDSHTLSQMIPQLLGSHTTLFDFDLSQSDRKTLRSIMALSICHNVTPTIDDYGKLFYQAASPDEFAMVEFADSIGVKLLERDSDEMTIQTAANIYKIIIQENDKLYLFMKGAESVMKNMIPGDWSVEEATSLARDGFRTLVFGMRIISYEEFNEFEDQMQIAKQSIDNRDLKISAAYDVLEHDLELLCVIGIEDKLQNDVPETIDLLRRAGIRLWMLTGDKMETALGIANTSTIIPTDTQIVKIHGDLDEVAEAIRTLDPREKSIVIDGESLQHCIDCFPKPFFQFCDAAKSVICARCSPQQKACVVNTAKHLNKRCCAIGDGGNDVGMIREADVGVGVEGKEGKQASLAADFSVQQFCYTSDLFLWHGRNAYKRTSVLSQVVIHRGMIMTAIQILFCSIFNFTPFPLFIGWFSIGYATFFNQLPIIMFVTDFTLSRRTTRLFPEIYDELRKGNDLSVKVYYRWLFTSLFQGAEYHGVMDLAYIVLNIVFILDCFFLVRTWNWYMVLSYIFSFILFFVTFYTLSPNELNVEYVYSAKFYLHTCIVLILPTLPRFIVFIYGFIFPPKDTKLDRKIHVTFTLSPNPITVLDQQLIQSNETYSILN
ncbi:Phospholipid-transporting ATPase [Entamoeba marina]